MNYANRVLVGSARQWVGAVGLVLAMGWSGVAGAQTAPAERGESQKVVRYRDFGAVGDGKADDLAAIIRAHAHANENDLPVRADDGATYYIGGAAATAIIHTNTDFGNAKFLIDDTAVENRRSAVFEVRSKLPSFRPAGVESLTKAQATLPIALPQACVVKVTNSGVKRYIRYGANQNSGASQMEVLVVDAAGNVDPNTPILWDYEKVTDIVAYPIDEAPLRITGGQFTTIANVEDSRYQYYARGIAIRRSNVVVDRLQHRITGEGETGAPYSGFIHIADCANVTVQNAVMTGRKTFRTIGAAGRPVNMGSYGLQVDRAANVSFINCTQTNDINDGQFWGIMASNYAKNITYDGCTLSRFDAHQGVYNATIRNSTLGHMGIQLIGSGTFILENSTVRAGSLISLRSDYGSTWEGEFIIRNCVLIPPTNRRGNPTLIAGSNAGQHDFGYQCYMPARIVIENLHINDTGAPANAPGPAVLADFNRDFKDDTYQQKFPYITTKELVLKNITTATGKRLRLSDNPFMFNHLAGALKAE